MDLERDKLEPDRYEYLSRIDSVIYDFVKDSDDPKDQIIKAMLEDKATASKGAHRMSTY